MCVTRSPTLRLPTFMVRWGTTGNNLSLETSGVWQKNIWKNNSVQVNYLQLHNGIVLQHNIYYSNVDTNFICQIDTRLATISASVKRLSERPWYAFVLMPDYSELQFLGHTDTDSVFISFALGRRKQNASWKLANQLYKYECFGRVV